MGSFSLVHWVVVIVILLLVFGPKRLSEVGKGLGQGIRNFKKGIEGGDGEAASGDEDEAPRLKKASTKKLEGKRKPEPEPEPDEADDEAEDDEADEEAARPRKKSKRA